MYLYSSNSLFGPILWDIQNNFFSGLLRLPPRWISGSILDASDNLLACFEATNLDLGGMVGDFSRNLCIGAGEGTYPPSVYDSSCSNAFPFAAIPCRRFELQQCSVAAGAVCRRVATTDLTVRFLGQLPAHISIYDKFSVQVGNFSFNCLNSSAIFVLNETVTTCTLLGGQYFGTGEVSVDITLAGVKIFTRSTVGITIIETTTAAPTPTCSAGCRVALGASSLSYTVNGTALPTSEVDVQEFYFTSITSKRAAPPAALDCKGRGSFIFGNGTSLTCVLPAFTSIEASLLGVQLAVTVSVFGAPLLRQAPTGLVLAAAASPTVLSYCQTNCVRRGTSDKLKIVGYGGNLPTSKADYSVFRVTIGTGYAPSGSQYSCLSATAGILFSFDSAGGSVTCEIDPSLISDRVSGAVVVDLVVWGNQQLLTQAPTGEVLQAGTIPAPDASSIANNQGSTVGVAVGVPIAVVVIVAAGILVFVFIIRRRMQEINIMQTAEMRELKASLPESQLKAVLNIKASDIKLVSQLGSGAFGTVWLAQYLGRFVAVKKLSGSALAGQLAEFFREASLLLSIPKHEARQRMNLYCSPFSHLPCRTLFMCLECAKTLQQSLS